MFITSNPLNVRLAVLNEPNPIPGLVNRLMNLWSCSTRLLRYLFCRNSTLSGNSSSAFTSVRLYPFEPSARAASMIKAELYKPA